MQKQDLEESAKSKVSLDDCVKSQLSPQLSPRILAIKKSSDFQKINKTGGKFHSHSLTLLTAPSVACLQSQKNKILSQAIKTKPACNLSGNFCRIGFTVSKSVSKSAVKRNLAKRQLREIARKLIPKLGRSGFDYVAIARREILNHNFTKIAGDFEFCLQKIHLPRQSKQSKK